MVVGKSIVKKVKGWELLTEDDLFVVRSFPGATTDDMESHIKPTLKNRPEGIIIHCRTNDLKNNTSQSMADNFLPLPKSRKENNKKITPSLYLPFVPRKDLLDKKGKRLALF